MRFRRWVAASATATVAAASLISAAPAAFASPTDPQVEVEGVVERLADTVGGVDTAVRLPSGDWMPVEKTGAARPGDRVAVTVPVPKDVVAEAAAGRTVEGIDGQVRLDRSDLRLAATRPAGSASDLSEATQRDVLDDGTVAPVATVKVLSHAQQSSTTPGRHEVTVAIVSPRGVKGRMATTAQVAAQVKNAGAYWAEQSGGSVTLNLARTVGPYASHYSCDDNPFQMWTEAARATGFVEGPGRHLVMVLPREATSAGCSYGLASMGENIGAGGIAYVADTAWPVLAHEIGHNFGLAHAKGLRCRSVTDADLARTPSSCSVEEYGDPYDVMAASAANSAGSLSVPQASRIGLIGSAGVVSVASGARTVTLSPVSSRKGVRGVRVRDPRSGAVYWVEFRTRTGRDAKLYMPMTAGVRVIREETATARNPWPATVALDASPTGRSNDASTAVPSGSVFTSYGAGITVSVVSVGRSSAKVTVSVGRPASLGATKPGAVTRRGAAAAPAAPKIVISGSGVVSWKTAAKGAKYDVSLRKVVGKSYGRTQNWYAGTSRTSATLKAARGTTLQVRARVRVGSKTSAWSGWRSVAFR